MNKKLFQVHKLYKKHVWHDTGVRHEFSCLKDTLYECSCGAFGVAQQPGWPRYSVQLVRNITNMGYLKPLAARCPARLRRKLVRHIKETRPGSCI